MTKNIINKITEKNLVKINNWNIDTAFKVAWVSFLCLGKITYINTKLKKALFWTTCITRSDILFFEGNQYIIFCLKQSMTDIEHTNIQITLESIGEMIYPIAILARFSTLDLQPAITSLFCHLFRAFTYFNMFMTLKKLISLVSLDQANHLCHSFHKSRAKLVANHDMLDKII